jgi:O-antigen ligase
MAAAAVVLSVVVGAVLTVEPVLATLPIVALLCALMLVDGRARTLLVIFGGLFVFQRGEGLDMSKVGFLALFGVAFVGAFVSVRGAHESAAYKLARPLLMASVALVALVALSLTVAHNNATPLVGAWLRDVAPYLLLASAPIFALDAHASFSRRGLVTILVTAGTVGAVAFAVHWLDRRGIADLQGANLGLASRLVPAALFAYGMSAVLQGRRNRWLVVSMLVLALLLVTGTRTNLVLLVAPLVIVLGARRQRASRSLRLALVAPVAVALTIALGLVVIGASGADNEFLKERITLVASTGRSADDSFTERLRQSRAAWEVFESNRIVGAGPGTIFQWETLQGEDISSFLLDTPLTYPAKFGLVGLVFLIYVIAKYWAFVRALGRRSGGSVAYLALLGYLAIAVASAHAYPPFDDKGLSFGLILLLALVFSDVSTGHRATEHLSARDDDRSSP